MAAARSNVKHKRYEAHAPQSEAEPPPVIPDLPTVESAIVEMTNTFRRAQGRSRLRRNAQLTAIARNYARYLIRTNQFSHRADGQGPGERTQAQGYAFCQVAENLALNIDSRGFRARQLASDVMTGWKNSSGHRKNLVAPHVVEIGVGVAKDKQKQKYISVQLFARPQTLQYQFRVRNETRAAVTYSLGDDSTRVESRVIVTHTECQPRTFKLQGPGAQGFPVRRGDLFILRPGRAGPRVIHRPAL